MNRSRTSRGHYLIQTYLEIDKIEYESSVELYMNPSRAPGWNQIKSKNVSTKNQSNLSSRAPDWNHKKFDQFSIENQSK